MWRVHRAVVEGVGHARYVASLSSERPWKVKFG